MVNAGGAGSVQCVRCDAGRCCHQSIPARRLPPPPGRLGQGKNTSTPYVIMSVLGSQYIAPVPDTPHYPTHGQCRKADDVATSNRFLKAPMLHHQVEGHDWWPARVVRRRAVPREVGPPPGAPAFVRHHIPVVFFTRKGIPGEVDEGMDTANGALSACLRALKASGEQSCCALNSVRLNAQQQVASDASWTHVSMYYSTRTLGIDPQFSLNRPHRGKGQGCQQRRRRGGVCLAAGQRAAAVCRGQGGGHRRLLHRPHPAGALVCHSRSFFQKEDGCTCISGAMRRRFWWEEALHLWQVQSCDDRWLSFCRSALRQQSRRRWRRPRAWRCGRRLPAPLARRPPSPRRTPTRMEVHTS